MAKRPPKEELEFADFFPDWLNTPSPFNELDNDWEKIIIFFVFHTPVKEVSARGCSFASFGWHSEGHNTQCFKTLKKRLIKFSKMENKDFLCVDNWIDMRESLRNNDLINFPHNTFRERITYRNDKGSENESLFNHIRNAFAHGRLAFYKKEAEIFIALEDIDDQRTITARMILSKKTLFNWIEVTQKGPDIEEEKLNTIL